MSVQADPQKTAIKWLVAVVFLLNFGYFVVELTVGLSIGSVSLTADSIDFLDDAVVNLLILVGLGASVGLHRRLSGVMGVLLLVPIAATLWMAWRKYNLPEAPDLFFFMFTATGAMLVNLVCAFLLVRHDRLSDNVRAASYFYERNDVLANICVIAAGVFTAFFWTTAWPDFFVGLALGLVNIRAAIRTWLVNRNNAPVAL